MENENRNHVVIAAQARSNTFDYKINLFSDSAGDVLVIKGDEGSASIEALYSRWRASAFEK